MSLRGFQVSALALGRRVFSTAAAPEAYALSVKWMHWLVGGGVLGCFATVTASQYTTKESKPTGLSKMELMNIHKSFGLCVAAGLVPRVLLRFHMNTRLVTSSPGHVKGANQLEAFAGSAVHYVLYGFMAVMSGTGVAMGYYGGKGLPFFGYTIPGAAEKDGAIAGQAYKLHKQVGPFFEYTVMAHSGAAVLHALRGHTIFARIIPGLTP